LKKMFMLLLLTILLYNGDLVSAKTEEKSEKVDGYFTAEDILFSIIEPKLIRIVHNQYDKDMIVNPVKVEDVAMVQKQIEKGKYNGWFEVKLSVLVGEPDGETNMDTVILEIDAPNIGGTAPRLEKDGVSGIEIKLVKYYKGN